MTVSRGDASKYLGLGVQLAVMMALCVVLGYLADRAFDTSPWLFLVMSAFGILAVLGRLYRVAVELPERGDKKT